MKLPSGKGMTAKMQSFVKSGQKAAAGPENTE